MVLVKCLKCGKEYELGSNEKLSGFQCECGGELSPNKKVTPESIYITKSKKKPNIKEDWDKQSKNRKIGIGIVGLCCLGIIIFVVLGGLFSPNKTTTTANSKTYSDNGLTFNYLDSWTINGQDITTPNGGTGIIYNFSLKEYASEDPPIPATLDAVAADIRSGVTGASNKKIITIGGVQGIEYIPTGSGRQRVDVIFVKGDALYSIYLTTNDYNADKDGFNMVIKTMKIQ